MIISLARTHKNSFHSFHSPWYAQLFSGLFSIDISVCCVAEIPPPELRWKGLCPTRRPAAGIGREPVANQGIDRVIPVSNQNQNQKRLFSTNVHVFGRPYINSIWRSFSPMWIVSVSHLQTDLCTRFETMKRELGHLSVKYFLTLKKVNAHLNFNWTSNELFMISISFLLKSNRNFPSRVTLPDMSFHLLCQNCLEFILSINDFTLSEKRLLDELFCCKFDLSFLTSSPKRAHDEPIFQPLLRKQFVGSVFHLNRHNALALRTTFVPIVDNWPYFCPWYRYR